MDGADVGVRGAPALLALVDAALGRDAKALDAARRAVVDELGGAALLDAAGVIGGFDAITRVADATGTPLEPEKETRTAALRAELGVSRFHEERERLGGA